MDNQEQFIKWLSEKLEASDEQDLQKKLKDLGEEGIKEAYQVFTKESTKPNMQYAKDGVKLKHLECLQLFKKGGKMKADCGCTKKTTKVMTAQSGAIMKANSKSVFDDGFNQLKGKTVLDPLNNNEQAVYMSKKGNLLSQRAWDFNTSGKPGAMGFATPKDQMDYIDGYAKPNTDMGSNNKMLTLGIGSQAKQYESQDVINAIKGAGTNYSLTRKDWDLNNLNKLQDQLTYDARVEGSGVNNLHAVIGMQPTNQNRNLIPVKSSINQIAKLPMLGNPNLMTNIAPQKQNFLAGMYKKGGKMMGKMTKGDMKDSKTALGGNDFAKGKDKKTTVQGYKINAMKKMKTTVGGRSDQGKDKMTAVKK